MSSMLWGCDVRRIREHLQDITPPYLLRKYEATPEEYEKLADEDLRCELIDGELIVHSPASIAHERQVMFLSLLLGNFIESRHLGRLQGANAVMQVGQYHLCPDLSFLAAQHEDRVQRGLIVGPVDLAIEMISRSTRRYDLDEKRPIYREAKVPGVWLIDPERKQWHVDWLSGRSYRSRTLRTGRLPSRALPGLSVDVTWLWADPLPNPLDCLAAATVSPRRRKV